ncbi:hypothetical protein R9C00_20195 [Flammeovirgaceae bacterium SG7u.111]|nr:hypothetical protein [Flammeovirgaceae bacterium SG7u.132]WPO34023.1 hypothetical protein R9C00_20195 [Flammeovirgaceae bacterium SG7u.111]
MEESTEKKGKRKIEAGVVIGLVAILINLTTVSIYVYEARIMQTQQEVSAWPYLEWQVVYNQNDGLSVEVSNNGIGPALIKSTKILLEGKVYENMDSMFVGLVGTTKFPHLTGRVENRVLPAGKSIRLLKVTDKIWAEKVNYYMLQKGFGYEVCFESIYGEAWTCTGLEVEESKCK